MAAAVLLVQAALAFGADASLPKLDSAGALEAFFFPCAEEEIFSPMKTVFRLDNPGVLVTAAAKAGPQYASKVAATIEYPEFKRQYSLLAKYLDLFGPCQRRQKPGEEGWWSSYKTEAGDAYCRDATKLVFAATLWSQVHYCQQLAGGEAKPRFGPPPAHNPPYRLDEPPVATHWVIAEAVYAITDRAIALRFQDVLRKRAEQVSESQEREAILEAAGQLGQESVNRERAGLALLKMMIRSYEAIHLRHIQKFLGKRAPAR